MFTSLPPLRCHFNPAVKAPGDVIVYRRNARGRLVKAGRIAFGTRTKKGQR